MSDSILQVNQIKDKGGNATGITVADTTANVTIGNLTATTAAINGGSINGGTIGGNVAMASSGLTVRNISQTALASDQSVTNSSNTTELFAPTYTPKFAGSTIQFVLTYCFEARSNTDADGRKVFRIYVSSADSGFSAINWGYNAAGIGPYDYGNNGGIVLYHSSVMGPLIVTSTTGLITASVRFQNDRASTNSSSSLRGNGTTTETYMTWIEYK